MKLVIIDGQSGRMGALLAERIKAAKLPCEVLAVGTNAIATAAMMKAGADQGATGENPVLVACRTAECQRVSQIVIRQERQPAAQSRRRAALGSG